MTHERRPRLDEIVVESDGLTVERALEVLTTFRDQIGGGATVTLSIRLHPPPAGRVRPLEDTAGA